MSARAYLVRGRDDYHDRGVRAFYCETAPDAARSYLRAYVEDWRGDTFPERLALLMRVWQSDQDEGEAAVYTGVILAKHDQRRDLAFQLDLREDGHAQN